MERIWRIFEASAAERSSDPDGDRSHGRTLAAGFRGGQSVRITPTRGLAIPDLAIAAFYRSLLADGARPPGTVPQPEPAAADSAWMLERDFAFVNIRACSREPGRSGTVVDALKLLPTMRVSAIHLAPFFDHTLDNLYAIDSVRLVADSVLDPALVAAGIDGDDQIRLLVDAIHLLGWKVGFDLEPHTSTFSRIVLAHPGCFRWLRLSADRTTLADALSQEEMLQPAAQERLVAEVAATVSATCRRHGLAGPEDLARGPAAVRDCHAEIVQTLMRDGYWTLPSHTWNGVGVPRFAGFVRRGLHAHPDYVYLDATGGDQHEHAFGMLSPFKLYDPLPVNAVPTAAAAARRVPEAIALFESIFPEVQARYGFDFVRLDYVDHVFDSTHGGDWTRPVSDRLTPGVLQDLLAAARRRRPETGAMAERMGVDVDEYGAVGFDLVLGCDMLTAMDADYVGFLFDLQRELDTVDPHAWRPITGPTTRPATAAPTGARRCSVLAAIDSHDSGHPLFWTRPLSDVVGADGMHLRHVLARFATCGPRRRPKYEVMGNQDLSSGLYAANNTPTSLRWADDEAFNRRYHAVEDLFDRFRDLLRRARMGISHVDRDRQWAVWFLDADAERLMGVAALEPHVAKPAVWAVVPPILEPTGPISIDVGMGTDWAAATVVALPLDDAPYGPVPLDGRTLHLGSLPPRGCRLFHVRRG